MVGLILLIIKTAVTNVCVFFYQLSYGKFVSYNTDTNIFFFETDITENINNFQFDEFALTYNQVE